MITLWINWILTVINLLFVLLKTNCRFFEYEKLKAIALLLHFDSSKPYFLFFFFNYTHLLVRDYNWGLKFRGVSLKRFEYKKMGSSKWSENRFASSFLYSFAKKQICFIFFPFFVSFLSNANIIGSILSSYRWLTLLQMDYGTLFYFLLKRFSFLEKNWNET